MEFDFLSPLDDELLLFNKTLSDQQLGNVIKKHSKNEFPDLTKTKIAIVGVPENRNSKNLSFCNNLYLTRKKTYGLFVGNWTTEIVDLGDIAIGNTTTDTYYALKTITATLLKKGIILICLGGSQDLTYPLYRAFDDLDQMVNLVSIDSKFDLGDAEDDISDRSYLSNIIIDEPNNLNNYSNIGYQTYYNSQNEINLIEKLHFDAYRLGETSKTIEISEPIMRNADLVSLDLTVLKANAVGQNNNLEPNGLDGKELCTLARYAGISEKLSVFGIFNLTDSENEATLVAQSIWYFIEGHSLRTIEFPNIAHDNFIKYIVPAEDQEIIFFKSIKTQRFWMQIPYYIPSNNKTLKHTLLPCSYEDYLSCCEQNIPERWWKAQQKNIL